MNLQFQDQWSNRLDFFFRFLFSFSFSPIHLFEEWLFILLPYVFRILNRFQSDYWYILIYAGIPLKKNVINSICWNVWKREMLLYWNGNITSFITIFVILLCCKKKILQSFYNWIGKTIVEEKNVMKSVCYAFGYVSFKINYLQGFLFNLIVISYNLLKSLDFYYCILQWLDMLSIFWDSLILSFVINGWMNLYSIIYIPYCTITNVCNGFVNVIKWWSIC